MKNNLEKINNEITFEKITVTALEKLDHNYVRIIGKIGYRKIDILTNGIINYDFSGYNKVKKIISFNGSDYLIAENDYNKEFLISLKDGTKIIEKAISIDYIGAGLFGQSNKDIFYVDKVYDLKTNDYVPFPDHMIFREYKDELLILQESDKKSYEQHKEMVIDRNGQVVIPEVNGRIRIINKTKFIVENKIIDFKQQTIIEDADLIMPLTLDLVIILKNRKLFILNKDLEVIKTYYIGESKKPWYYVVQSEECVTMTFKKKIRNKKYEPRIEKDVTVIVNTKKDTVSKVDCLPRLSLYDVFIITDEKHKKGLMNKKGEIILNVEWDSIKELNDANHKYFFLGKDSEHFIFNSKTKELVKVAYTEIEEYRDGLALAYNDLEENYQLLDEELNPIFNLDFIGHTRFYYQNGILCYHSGNWTNGYDAYTIITQTGETLMCSKECRFKRNGFGLLEITDLKNDKNIFFNMNTGQFLQLEINVPLKKLENGEQYDFSGISFQQLFLEKAIPLLREENMEELKRLLIPKLKKDVSK